MGEKIEGDYCKDSEEVLSSEVLWDIGKRIIESIDRYSTEYYIPIIEKIKNQQAISEQEYSDMIELLDSKDYKEKAEEFRSKVNIRMSVDSLSEATPNISHLESKSIILSVKEQAGKSLIKTLKNTLEKGEVYRVLGREYISVEGVSENIICKIFYEKNTSNGKIFVVESRDGNKGVLAENGDIIVPLDNYYLIDYNNEGMNEYFLLIKEENENTIYGLVDIEGKEIYGKIQWEEAPDRIITIDGQKYAVVKKRGKYGLVDIEGEEIYGGCKWAEIGNVISTPSGEDVLIVRNKKAKYGIVTENGIEKFGGCEWDNINKIIEDENHYFYAIVARDSKYGLVSENGEEVYGGTKWEGIKSYVLSPDEDERYWEVVQEKSTASLMGDKTGLVDYEGNPVYGKNWTDIRGFVVDPNGETYLRVYDHADAYCLEGLIKKDGTDAFGGCRRRIKEVNFYQNESGKLYLQVPNLKNNVYYVDIDGNKKSIFTIVRKVSD